MRQLRTIIAIALAAPCLAACVDTDPDLGEDQAEIILGSTPPAWMVARAVKLPNCTATLIAPRFALTALHCIGGTDVGDAVHFYTSASAFSPSLERTITEVHLDPGTVGPPTVVDDYYDTAGLYSDFALLELDAAAPASSTPATLYWTYPGAGVVLGVVGAGNHDNANTNPGTIGALRYATEVTTSDDDDSGMYVVAVSKTNHGDSGGPEYISDKVLGVTHGSGRLTSVPAHLHWILGQIGFAWHNAIIPGWYRAGTITHVYDGLTERVCQYACEHASCDAYDYVPSYGHCVLVTDVVALVYAPAYRTSDR